MLALRELRAGAFKFGLIGLVIALVVSLTLIMSAMSGGLISGMTGAKASLDADALVFQKDTYPTFERSILSAEDMSEVVAASGVEQSYGVGHAFATVEGVDEAFDVRVFGIGGRFEQFENVEGSTGHPGPGEAIADESARLKGLELGDTVTLEPIGYEVTVVGFTEGRRYIMVPTLTVGMDTWEDIYTASVLGEMAGDEPVAGMEGVDLGSGFTGSASVAAVVLEPGTSVEDLTRELEDRFEVATPEDASIAGNGMTEMVLAVDGIQWVSIVIGALLVGLFFYITTMHKTSQIAAIKAIGASNAYLYRQLLLQITVLVSSAVAVAVALSLALGSAMPPAMAFEPQPAGWALSIAAVFVTSYLGSVFSLWNILQVDPATALGRSDR